MKHPHNGSPYRRTHDPGFGGGGGAISGTKSGIGDGGGSHLGLVNPPASIHGPGIITTAEKPLNNG